MKKLEERNQRIIDAIIQKAHRVCPGALALIGIYGSFATGDAHEKSDLDLLVLVNDERGFQLGCAFIQDDLQVGHDIYCTTWDSLERDAEYSHPNISKLMDSKIVYCADPKYLEKLKNLRTKAATILQKPLTKEDFQKAEKLLKDAEHFYMAALIAESLSETKVQAGKAVYYAENALAMLNKAYFRFGTKRTVEELESMARRPTDLRKMIEAVLSAETAEQLRQHLTALVHETARVFQDVDRSLPITKQPVLADNISGTFEEMFSNWRNKIHAAADINDRHLAFMSMTSMQAMQEDIHSGVDIGCYDVMVCYDPNDLRRTAEACDEVLERYLAEYQKAGISANRYENIGAFLTDYLKDHQN